MGFTVTFRCQNPECERKQDNPYKESREFKDFLDPMKLFSWAKCPDCNTHQVTLEVHATILRHLMLIRTGRD